MTPRDFFIWASGLLVMPLVGGVLTCVGGRLAGWPGWFIILAVLALGICFWSIGYQITSRYFEQAERDREPGLFASRILSLAILLFVGAAAGYGYTAGYDPSFRFVAGIAAGGTVYLGLSSLWFGFPERHERGRKVLHEEEVDRKERELEREMAEEEDPGMPIGRRLIPSMYANSHILFMGATRTGKTLLQRILYQEVLKSIGVGSDHRAVIYDAKGDMHSLLAGMELNCEVRTLNPFDRRSYSWWLSKDITDRGDAETFAELMVPFNPKLTQQHWDETLRGIIEQLVTTYMERDNGEPVDWTFRDVIYPLRAGREVLEHVLEQTEDGRALVKKVFKNEEHGGNVDATLAAKARAFAVIAALWHAAERENRRLSLEDWGREEYILLLGHSHKLRATMRTLNQMTFKRLSQVILDMDESPTRKNWLLFDELRQAGRLDGLTDFLVEGASRGACMVSGFQDKAGLEHEYDVLLADEFIGQHHIVVTTKLVNEKTAKAVSEKFGEYERWVKKKSFTRSYDGRSVTEQEELVRAPSVLPSDLMNLPRPNPKIGLESWNITPLGAYHEHIPGDSITRALCPGNTDPERGGMPNLLPRSREDQRLLPWTKEDYERLKLPLPKWITDKNTPPPQPPEEEGEADKEWWLEIVPDPVQDFAEARERRARRMEEDDHWQAILRCRRRPTDENARAAKRAYQALAVRLHPDRGGDHEAFIRLKAAYDQAMEEWTHANRRTLRRSS